MDGVDFQIEEPKPFDRKWFSHKFKAAALRYEIGLNIRTGHIIWKFGGYPAGSYPDLKLARELYIPSLPPGEKTIADRGYNDTNFFVTPRNEDDYALKIILSRHETVNKRIRQYRVLKNVFRHSLDKHVLCFDAVVNITQLIIKFEQPLFDVLQD